jgi:hypothetical protein
MTTSPIGGLVGERARFGDQVDEGPMLSPRRAAPRAGGWAIA